MKAVDYREMPEEELTNTLAESNEELFKLKLQQSLGQLENPARIRTLRRQVARIQTVLTQRTNAPAAVEG